MLPDALSRIVIHNAMDPMIPVTKLQELGGSGGTPNASNTIQLVPGYAKLSFSFYQLQPPTKATLTVQTTSWISQKVYNSSTCQEDGNVTVLNGTVMAFIASGGLKLAMNATTPQSPIVAYRIDNDAPGGPYWPYGDSVTFYLQGKSPISGKTCFYKVINYTDGFVYNAGDGWQRIIPYKGGTYLNGAFVFAPRGAVIFENAGNGQTDAYLLKYNETTPGRYALNQTLYMQVAYGMNPQQTYVVNAGHISDRGTVMSFMGPYRSVFNMRSEPAKAMYVLWK